MSMEHNTNVSRSKIKKTVTKMEGAITSSGRNDPKHIETKFGGKSGERKDRDQSPQVVI